MSEFITYHFQFDGRDYFIFGRPGNFTSGQGLDVNYKVCIYSKAEPSRLVNWYWRRMPDGPAKRRAIQEAQRLNRKQLREP